MGLDNIPHVYPCKKNGTAVIIDDRVHCKETQEAGGCPWLIAVTKDNMTDGHVYGMLGTDCWYRGKYGNALLHEAGFYDDTDSLNFYGDNEDGTEKSPESCVTLADVIGELLDDNDPELSNDTRQDLKYAEWYLRWAARECEGLHAWY